jgi:tripartite-type tricarboxylate transporter receptor subunit TctC
MPSEVLKKLNDAMVKVLTDPVVVKKFADLTAQARPSTPAELAAVFDREDRVVVPLIKKLGIKVE